jgi:hypothetical protein
LYAGALNESMKMLFSSTDEISPPTGYRFAGIGFDLQVQESDVLLDGISFNQPVSLTIAYPQSLAPELGSGALVVFRWDPDSAVWRDAAETCSPPFAYIHDADKLELTVLICSLSRFALMLPISDETDSPDPGTPHDDSPSDDSPSDDTPDDGTPDDGTPTEADDEQADPAGLHFFMPSVLQSAALMPASHIDADMEVTLAQDE